MIQIRLGEAVYLHCHPVVLGGFADPFHAHPACCREAAAISGAHHCEHFPRAGAEGSVGDSVTRFCTVPLTPVWRSDLPADLQVSPPRGQRKQCHSTDDAAGLWIFDGPSTQRQPAAVTFADPGFQQCRQVVTILDVIDGGRELACHLFVAEDLQRGVDVIARPRTNAKSLGHDLRRCRIDSHVFLRAHGTSPYVSYRPNCGRLR